MNSTTNFIRCFVLLVGMTGLAVGNDRPNILWIYVDDMNDWMGCYGDAIAQTPHIDDLAEGGVLFENAFMPAPVCSTTRSALMIGAMQTSHGLHQHRTMIKKPLPETIRTVPELFREAGYLTFNEAKDDYNFQRSRDLMYSPEFERPTTKQVKAHLVGHDLRWLEQLQGKPFFGQIQLKGGKLGGETGSRFPSESRFDEDQVTVPPQYPDHPAFRDAIARHYEQIAETDAQVGAIVDGLKAYGLWDNTIVFFFTDHGSPLPRAKQFLYEDGTKVPLIVRWPSKFRVTQGTSRSDLVSGIDISTSSLGLAGIEIPAYMEGRNLFAEPYAPRQFVVSARDRMGNAIDRIRSVRSTSFRYIRNYMTDRALYQPQYRDNYATFSTLRDLLAEDKLSELQASYHDSVSRPSEELYDLNSDPHQTKNLVANPDYGAVLNEHRRILDQWVKETGDRGRFPESKASLQLVYENSAGTCVSPEYDFLKDASNANAPDSLQQPLDQLNFRKLVRPVPSTAKFIDDDLYIWGGSMARGADGRCHLFYSRWPRELGHNAWVTHSEIAHAVADDPLGPYVHVDVALPPREGEHWDGMCTHNPTVHRFDGRYYLYYMGNTGDGNATKKLNWIHRNNQRIGVAVADDLDGPWRRFDQPLIDVSDSNEAADALMTSNPSILRRADGVFVLIYKAVGKKGKQPFGGPVVHLAATSDSPTGPFAKHRKPLFTAPGVKFPAEDPYIWASGNQCWAIVNDHEGHFNETGEDSLALFTSRDGLAWSVAPNPWVLQRKVRWKGESPSLREQSFHRLERPQLWLENGIPKVLFCAAEETKQKTHSFNVHIPLFKTEQP